MEPRFYLQCIVCHLDVAHMNVCLFPLNPNIANFYISHAQVPVNDENANVDYAAKRSFLYKLFFISFAVKSFTTFQIPI